MGFSHPREPRRTTVPSLTDRPVEACICQFIPRGHALNHLYLNPLAVLVDVRFQEMPIITLPTSDDDTQPIKGKFLCVRLINSSSQSRC